MIPTTTPRPSRKQPWLHDFFTTSSHRRFQRLAFTELWPFRKLLGTSSLDSTNLQTRPIPTVLQSSKPLVETNYKLMYESLRSWEKFRGKKAWSLDVYTLSFRTWIWTRMKHKDFEKTMEVARTCLRSQDPKASNQRPKCRVADPEEDIEMLRRDIQRFQTFVGLICTSNRVFSFAGCANQPGWCELQSSGGAEVLDSLTSVNLHGFKLDEFRKRSPA